MKRPTFYFVKYQLYGMEKNIIFQSWTQFKNWEWALNKLNYSANEDIFKIIQLEEERY